MNDVTTQPVLKEDLDGLRREKGTCFFTLSLLVEQEYLRKEIGDDNWTIEKRRAIRFTCRDSGTPAAAIEPLFDDIADRRRHLFIDDFLLDPVGGTGTDAPNETIQFNIPGTVRWATEGNAFEADLGSPLELSAQCRMFWFVHSNGSLSYHLSFDLQYEHDFRHYYALSLIQKLVFEKEQTEWAQEISIVERSDGRRQRFWDFVTEMFEEQARELFARLDLCGKDKERHRGLRLFVGEHAGFAHGLFSRSDPHRVKPKSYWESLLATQRDSERETLAEVGGGAGHDRYPERRAVILLKDPYFFRLLGNGARQQLSGFGDKSEPFRGQRHLDAAMLEKIDARRLDYYFLSGFFQNITDFLRQDTSEVQDGTDPIYPPADRAGDDGHFVVYANSTTIYEVVSASRSLEVARRYIGTCPYLFLVHIMTFHNEALVKLFEREVTKLVHMLEEGGLTPGEFQSMSKGQAIRVLEKFLHFRLTVFQEIQKHVYFNVLRYDTERAFFEQIEDVRGMGPRRVYWEGVLERLEATVSDIRERLHQMGEERLNKVLFIIAFFSIFQVLFQISDSFRKFILDTKRKITPFLHETERHILPDNMELIFISLVFILFSILFFYGLRYLWHLLRHAIARRIGRRERRSVYRRS